MDVTRWLYTRRPPRAVMSGLVGARRGLRGARARLGPVNAEIIDRTLALAEIRALGIAAELDLAELVERGPRTSEELARMVGADADALDRMMALLAATGCFRRGRDRRWRNTRVSSALRESHPLSMRDWARFFAGPDHLRIWAAADWSVRTGGSATERETGHEFFEWVTRHAPEIGERFNGAMLEASRFLGPSLVHHVDLSRVETICDVGGGTGRLLAIVLAAHPEMRGVLFDLPEVVAGAAPVLADAGVADRVEVASGSFFDGVPPGADRYLLGSVVHDWDDARAGQILTSCRRALPPGGRVLVVEQVLDPSRPTVFSHHSDVLMLVLTGAGRERTTEQFRRLFAGAGLEIERSWELSTLHTVFELRA